MFTLPLPTDNLYKFVALAGLALIAIGYFFTVKSQDELNKQQETLLWKSDELERSVDKLKDYTVYFPRHKPQAKPEEPNTDLDSLKYFEYVRSLCKCDQDFARQFEYALTMKDKQLYLTDPAVREAFKALRGFTDAEYEKWVQSSSMLEIQDLVNRPTGDIARKVIDNARMLELEAFHYYGLVGRANDERQVGKWFSGGGAVLMVLGFILWWWKVQRYQDRLLRRKVSEVDGKSPTP